MDSHTFCFPSFIAYTPTIAQFAIEVKYVKKEQAHLFDKGLKEGEAQLSKYLATYEVLMGKEHKLQRLIT